MKVNGLLTKKTFTTDSGEVRDYYVLQIVLSNGESVEVPVKKDKALIIILSNEIDSLQN